MYSQKGFKTFSLLFSSLFLSSILYAEDIEIFGNDSPAGDSNVLFVLDVSGSMYGAKIADLKSAFEDLMVDPELDNINVGLMGFAYKSIFPKVTVADWSSSAGPYTDVAKVSGYSYRGVAFPVSPIDDDVMPIMLSNLLPQTENNNSNSGFFTLDNDSLINPLPEHTVREYLPYILNSWEAYGATPILESLYESALYFRGEPPVMGDTPPDDDRSAHPSTYTGKIYRSGNSSNIISKATYNSPIKKECQSNAIVLLSDGVPHNGYDFTHQGVSTLVGRSEVCTGSSDCGIDLVKFLSTSDQSEDVDGINKVKTYTIGFGVEDNLVAESYLRALASNGDGDYYPATSSSGLVDAFKDVIETSGSQARSYAAPAYTVDPSSLLAHSRDIYLPLFDASKHSLPMWSGNLKKFKLNDSGEIIDQNGEIAIDADGALKNTAKDFWAKVDPTSESNPVTSGGVANQIVPGTRKILTDTGTSGVLRGLSTTHVSKEQLGNAAMTDAEKTELLQFIKGYESDGATPRHHVGDILHSKPTVVSYPDKQVVFFGTNEGFLHAVNAADATESGEGGKELFAFMPSSLLANIEGQMSNTELTGDLKRIYGVDGSITVWINDKNKNGIIESGDGDTVYLYFGLRRGGNHMYALNVTDPNNPELLWKLSNTDIGFGQLAETWSKPVLAQLRYKPGGTGEAVTEKVLVFGGGYDNRLDQSELSGRPSLDSAAGNVVYIVNATTKSLIKALSHTELKHSVPGDIRVLDLDRNGSIDRLYFGDTGGNIWRADLNVDDVDSDESLYDVTNDATLFKFASLGGVGNGSTDYRKFFYEPDVSFFKYKGKYVLLVTIGSGYRVFPLNDQIEDRFYVLSDENVLNIPTDTPAPITDSDLALKSTLNGDFLPNHKGWYMPLVAGQGEKVLSSPVIFMNKVMFTTFGVADGSTVTQNEDNCSASSDTFARAYVLDLMSASPAMDPSGGDKPYIDLPGGEIPGSPQPIFDKLTNCTNEGCDQTVTPRVGNVPLPVTENLGDLLPKVYWLNKIKDLSND